MCEKISEFEFVVSISSFGLIDVFDVVVIGVMIL